MNNNVATNINSKIQKIIRKIGSVSIKPCRRNGMA